jgi:hypothetical protein
LTVKAPVIRIHFLDHHNSGFGIFAQDVGQQLGDALNQVLLLPGEFPSLANGR